MDVKASSTAFDAVVFVLLVGAAVATLAGADPRPPAQPERVADETADVLATSTTEVEFRRSGTVRDARLLRGSATARTVTVERRAHGTYAELLAAAAVADPRLGAQPLTGSGGDLEDGAVNATRRALPTRKGVEVRATWRPYRGSTLGRTVVAGERPPRDADVSVGTATVPSGFPNVSARLGVDPTYDAVARAVAEGVVEGLFPTGQTRDALASEGPDRAVVADRYRATSAALSVDTAGPLARGEVTTANARIVAALAVRLRADLVAAFDSPEAAARAVSVDRVRVVVRAWSA